MSSSLRFVTVLSLTLGLCASSLRGQSYTFRLLAGTPPPLGTVDGTGAAARFNTPTAVAVGPDGNVYVADALNHTIRKVTPAGLVTTLAGSPGNSGSFDGRGSNARFNQPWGIAVDRSGVIFVADYGNHTIRRIAVDGTVVTLAGEPGVRGSSDGTGFGAHFYYPTGVAVDSSGNVFVADRGNRTIRKITSGGVVSTFAGVVAVGGNTDGIGAQARFNAMGELAIDSSDNMYVPDTSSHVIRKITSTAVVTTLAGTVNVSGTANGVGTAAQFYAPRGVGTDANGNVFVADSYNETIRKIAPDGTTTTVAGDTFIGNANGSASSARFNFPVGVAIDAAGTVYVADGSNHSIRKITAAGVVSLLAGGGGSFGSNDGKRSAAQFYLPTHGTIDSDDSLILTDSYNGTIRRVTSSGVVTTVTGQVGKFGYVDGTISDSQFVFPYGVTTDGTGSIWVADSVGLGVRRISLTAGTVRTTGGTPGQSGSTDGAFNVGKFTRPHGIAVDSDGTLYVADTNSHTIRKIVSGVISTFAGQAGLSGSTDGTGAAARFNSPNAVAVASDGTLFVADSGNHTIRKVTTAGVVTTFSGQVGISGATDGSATLATFGNPAGLAIDRQNNLYVADSTNSMVRKVAPDGRVTTIGGVQGSTDLAEGTGSNAHFMYPMGVAVDSTGTVYVIDNEASVVMAGSIEVLPKITLQPQNTTVITGTSTTLSVIATGGGLSYQWEFNGAAIPGATDATYTISNAQSAQAGSYAVTISNSAGVTASAKATLTVSAKARVGRISNLAIRSLAGTGSQTLIVGFSIGGNGTSGAKPLLVRAIGPTLGAYGVSGTMPDPMLEVYSQSTGGKLTENDNWNGDAVITNVGASVGAFPFSGPTSKDAAIYRTTFGSGSYTANVSGVGGVTGVAMAEIWDTTADATFDTTTPRLNNVSARTQVGLGGDVLIAGFVISGETPKNVLIRAIGPTLASFGVNGTLSDPKLELYNGSSVKINENDDWVASTMPAGYDTLGTNRLSPKEAALVVTLPPGNYSAQVSGVGNTTGVALIELYELP